MKFLLSTMADIVGEEKDGKPVIGHRNYTAPLAAQYGLAMELAEFCISENLDEHLEETDRIIREDLETAQAVVLHGPYNELFPSAIDSKAVAFAKFRYEQALLQAQAYGIRKLVIHSGYVPLMYHESWFLERSVVFWKNFLAEHPGDYVICLENVMDEDPEVLCRLAGQVDDERFQLCLDVGHAHIVSKVSVLEWVERFAPWLSHLHIHNNDGTLDTHNGLDDGEMDYLPILKRCEELCPDATCTIESSGIERSVNWLIKERFLR